MSDNATSVAASLTADGFTDWLTTTGSGRHEAGLTIRGSFVGRLSLQTKRSTEADADAIDVEYFDAPMAKNLDVTGALYWRIGFAPGFYESGRAIVTIAA
jgi:hypothetical protein